MAVIRRADRDDCLTLERIEKQSFPSPHWRAAHFLVYECTVAEVDGVIAGFLVARSAFEGDEITPAEREILNLAVDPSYRRQGIATALLSAELRRRATHFLEVRQSNIAAQKLYAKFGFKEVGRRADYYSDPIETAIVMSLKWW